MSYHVKLQRKVDTGEYRVRVYRCGKAYEPADYFTTDRNDAVATRLDMLEREKARHDAIIAKQKANSGKDITEAGLTMVGREIVRKGTEMKAHGATPANKPWRAMLQHLESLARTESGEYGDAIRYCVATLSGALRKDWKGLLQTPRKDSTDAVYCFIRAVRWHGGATGGSLWGPIGDATLYPDSHSTADTFAIVLRVALGWRMTSVDRWRKAIHG